MSRPRIAAAFLAVVVAGTFATSHASAATSFDFEFQSAYASAAGHSDAASVSAAFGWTPAQLHRRAARIVFTYTEHNTWQAHCANADGTTFSLDNVTDLSAPIQATVVHSKHKVTDFTLHGVASNPPVLSTLDQIMTLPNGGCPAGTTNRGSSGDTEAAVLATFHGTTVTLG
jgi:hypothetical protein